MGVIILVAYLLTRSRIFPEILDGHPTLRTQIILVILFGALSIYGTLSGIEVEGSYINVRDLGPLVAGLLGGPYVGIAAGIIGGSFRFTLGGFTVIACSLAAVFAGLFGGLVRHRYNKKFCGITTAVCLAIFMELFHMGLILLLSHPFSEALEVVWAVVLPMVIANTTGVFIFAIMVGNVESERRMQAQRDTLLREIEHKDTELAIAAGIQQDFLPLTLPPTEGFIIAARNIPAKEVGGDFYDVIPPSDLPGQGQKTAVLIADVSGKGMPAALFMALSQTVVRVLATSHTSPADLISRADTIITSRSHSGMFVTLFYGVLDPESRTLSFINAGHNPPFILRAGSIKPEDLFTSGPALGLPGTGRFREYRVPLHSGDTIVLYTDGITEALNPAGEEFGTGRLVDSVTEHASVTPQEIVDTVVSRVMTFAGSEPQADDITILVIRVQ
ncbi:MAG: SpoIIE family protein phosphatase [Methanomicrobiales archaeon]|nr:SpoIIE family protein phosphatase [Methanomicrobiales archaeon]